MDNMLHLWSGDALIYPAGPGNVSGIQGATVDFPRLFDGDRCLGDHSTKPRKLGAGSSSLINTSSLPDLFTWNDRLKKLEVRVSNDLETRESRLTVRLRVNYSYISMLASPQTPRISSIRADCLKISFYVKNKLKRNTIVIPF